MVEFETLKGLIPAERIKPDEPLKGHTTFRVGGPAKYLIEVNTAKELKDVTSFLNKENVLWMILGNGSNILVSDKGYEGVMIKLSGDFMEISADAERVSAGAGALLSSVAIFAKDHSLGGLEFSYGIPGTIGGAMVMNAGAYDGEMKMVVESVECLDDEGKVVTLSNEQMQFGYRDSILKHQKLYALKTIFKLESRDKETIAATMKELMERRVSKQPLNFPSAGSTFKRPEGYFAGKLIQDAGLAGKRVGGASVSTKHCGFVVNDENATAKDINDLIKVVTDEVHKSSGVWLETEVIRIGDFN